MQTKKALYSSSEKTFQDIASKVSYACSSDQKNAVLKSAITSYAFTCKQVWGLLESYSVESYKLAALAILKNNIIDLENQKKEICDKFGVSSSKTKAAQTLAYSVNAKVAGEA